MTEEPPLVAGRRRWREMNRRGFVGDMVSTAVMLTMLAAVSFGVHAFVGWQLDIIEAGEVSAGFPSFHHAAHYLYSMAHTVIPWLVGLFSVFAVGLKLGEWSGRRYEQQVAGA